jgi:hypothetical protein
MLGDRMRQVAPATTVSALGLINSTAVERSTLTVSNTVTLSGLVGPTAVSITGGEYSINGAAFTSATGSVANGNTFAVRHTSSASYTTSTSTSVQIGVSVTTWSSTTRAERTTPAAFSFTALTSTALSTVQTSSSITVSGLDTGTVATVTILAGNYSKNGAGYASTATTAINGDIFSVQHVSSASYATATQTVLTINNQSGTFTSTTRIQDVIPTAFSFTALTGVEPATTYLSGTITVGGMDTGAVATVTVSGGSYSKNGGAFVTAAGTAQNGDVFQVSRLSAAASTPLTAASTVLTIGGVAGTFTVTTRAADTTPAAFTFTDITNGTLSTIYTSNTITVSGIDSGYSVPVSYTGFGVGYSKNGGTYTTSAGTAVLGDTFSVRLTSNVGGGVAHTGTLTIGGVSDTYSVTTKVGDTTPDPYTFTDLATQACNTEILSNVLVVTGVEATYSATLSLSGTGASWRKNGGAWFAAGTGGAVMTNDTVQIRIVTDNVLNKTWTASVNIGGVPDSWIVVTGNDGTPNAFNFTDITGAALSTEYVSAAVTIAGMTSGYRAQVLCSGVTEYNAGFKVNGGTTIRQGSIGSITNGDTLQAVGRTTAASGVLHGIFVNVGPTGSETGDTWFITTA